MKPPVFDPQWPDEVQAVYRHDLEQYWARDHVPHVWEAYQNQLAIYGEIVRARCPGAARVLDVGCAQAAMALRLAESGHRVVAVDIRQSFLDYAMTRYTHGDISFICGNILELPMAERFDIVFANQLIEHMTCPQELLTVLRARLKPGGSLVLTTPNWRYLASRLPSFHELGDVAQYADKQFTADGDGHFFAWREDELCDQFRSAGFHNIEASLFETPFICGHMKIRHVYALLPMRVWKFLDQLTLATPVVRDFFAHQLMVIGTADD